MIVVAKFYCTTALLKCRRRGSYCYSFLYCLLLLIAALTAAISIAETAYSAIFIQKMRRNAAIAAPPAAAAATAAAATTAAAVVSFRLYDYFLCNVTVNPIPAVAAGTS
jgi:SNF family Na+-dependent transporter